ncbi:MAG: tRNA (adenine37-N6)-methyltransferase [Chloroflexota bacterium]|nr:tRNA (adenine37-N6)-methyltransferase [Chloroflexota bacterium]
MKITFEPIGVVHSPFSDLADMPIQPTGEQAAEGTLELFPDYCEALADLDGFSHIYALYYFHKSKGWKASIVPFLDTQARGLFSTRAPRRPNPIGLSLLRVLSVEGCVVKVAGVDILDGTPLLDIKPYIPQFENPQDVRVGWLAGHADQVKRKRSDHRFED